MLGLKLNHVSKGATADHFQVLVADPDMPVNWIPGDAQSEIPAGAVAGGCSVDGMRSFIVQTPSGSTTTASFGFFEEGNQGAEFIFIGDVSSEMYFSWNFLVYYGPVLGTSAHNKQRSC